MQHDYITNKQRKKYQEVNIENFVGCREKLAEDKMSDRVEEMKKLPTPCYVVDEAKIEQNLKILRGVMDRTGARILLAWKSVV